MTNEQQTTGADGIASFELEYGDYTVQIEAEGYQKIRQDVAFRKNHKNFPISMQEIVYGDYDFAYKDYDAEVSATGTANIDGDVITFLTSTDSYFLKDTEWSIGETDSHYYNGFYFIGLTDIDVGGVGDISLIRKNTVSIRPTYNGEYLFETTIFLSTDELDFEDIDWSKVVGVGTTSGLNYDGALLYEFEDGSMTDTVATIPDGEYHLYIEQVDYEILEHHTITVTERNNKFEFELGDGSSQDNPSKEPVVEVNPVRPLNP